MEQPVAEKPFSQEQHANQRQSWHNGTMDNRGTQLQDPDPRKGAVWNRTNMSNGSFNGEDIREDKGRASVCRDNIRGRCTRGLSCKYQHSDFVDHDGARFNGNDQRNLGPAEDPRTSQLPFKKRYPQLYSENKEGRSRSPCRNFQNGRCFRGSSCPHLHLEFSNYNETNVDDSRRSSSFREGSERSLCRNYQSGRCYRGSTCPYLHPEFSEAEQQHAVVTASRNPRFHNGNVDNSLHSSQEHHGVVTASRNSRFHEVDVDNNLQTSQMCDAANQENNSKVSFSIEPQSKSPCRNFLQGRCQFGASCRRWHPDNAFNPRVPGNSNNNGFSDGHSRKHSEPHQHINFRTGFFSGEPRSRSPCQYFQRGSCYQGGPSSNSHPVTVYERTRYDSGEQRHQGVRAISRDLSFDRSNGVREVNYHGGRPYQDTHSCNRETMNVTPRSWSSERKRSWPESDFGGNQQPPEVCLKFTKGRCDQGGNCRYLHSFHEYASSSSQQSQKPPLDTDQHSMNVGQANQGAEGNENVNLWSLPYKRQRIWSRPSFSPEENLHNRTLIGPEGNENVNLWSSPYKRQRIWSRPSFSPEENLHNRTLRRDCSLRSDRSRSNHESQNQYPDCRPFKFYGPANRMNKEQHLKVASTSVNPSLRDDTNSIVMPPDGNGELVTDGIKVETSKEATATSEANTALVVLENRETAGVTVDLNHEPMEKTEETYSRKKRVQQHPETDDIGDVLANDQPEQGNEVATLIAATRDDILLGDSDNSALQASQPSDTAILKSRRKLLVLDVNGIIADIVADFPDRCKPDITVAGKGVFKRPFCDEFLLFCFEKFDVGIWSSRTQKNVTRVLDCLMENTKSKLLFCWHQSHCTETGYNTVENKEKPLLLKELKKLWDKEENDLPWKKGFYDETNTILLDDSPYKALRNPPYTAVFPFPYSFKKVNDNSLGLDGDLRLYLERLAEAENVQKFIQENPFGQRPITKANLSWTFYSRIAGEHAMQQEAISRSTPDSS